MKDANDLAKYTMLRTFAHEFTHFIENWNPVQYNTFKSFVLNALTQNGKNAEAMIAQKQAADPSLSREAVSREVVAEAMTDILPDAQFMEALAMRHKTIFDKLLSGLKAFVMKLKQAMVYKRMGLNKAAEANALKKQVDGALHYMDSIVKQFDKIVVQAVENYQQATVAEVVTSNNVADTTVQHQRREYLDDKKPKKQKNVVNIAKQKLYFDMVKRACFRRRSKTFL